MAIRTGYQEGQFCWIDLWARDMAEARRFYRELFGWESQEVEGNGGPGYAEFSLEGKRVAGVEQMSEAMLSRDLPSMWHNFINVEDLEATCDQAAELGGKVTMPPAAPRASRLAFVEDPTGAQVGLWQKESHFGAELTQDFHCCCWNELLTRDIDRAREFYGRLLGWEFSEYTSSDAKYYVVSQHGEETSGLLQMDERWGDMPPRWMVYFAVQSVDLSVDYVRQLGGFVQIHPYDIPEGRFAMVADPHGGSFDMVEMSEAGEGAE